MPYSYFRLVDIRATVHGRSQDGSMVTGAVLIEEIFLCQVVTGPRVRIYHCVRHGILLGAGIVVQGPLRTSVFPEMVRGRGFAFVSGIAGESGLEVVCLPITTGLTGLTISVDGGLVLTEREGRVL